MDISLLAEIAESFSFSEIRKTSLLSRFSTVLCDCISDKDLLANCGGIVLPMARMTLYLTFAPVRG